MYSEFLLICSNFLHFTMFEWISESGRLACMHSTECTYIYVRMYVRVYVCVYVRIYRCRHTNLNGYTHTHWYIILYFY